jgi:hypothetical protein
MLDRLRTPFFVLAVIAVVMSLGAEIGSRFIPVGGRPSRSVVEDVEREARAQLQGEEDLDADEKEELIRDVRAQARSPQKPPGLGVPSLGLLDSLLLFSLIVVGLGLIVPERLHGRVQGIGWLIVSILVLIAAIVLILVTLVKALIMIALFLAAPFGTIAYLGMYGSFNRSGAAAVLGVSMFLKMLGAVLLVVAHQRFLQNKGLVLLMLTSLLGNIIVSFLHGLVPIILVSITDAVAAIIIGILAAIWAIVLLVGSIISIIKAVF